MDYLIKASAIITLFYFCFLFFLKKETFFNENRWFLLLGLVASFLLPFVVIPVYIELIPETTFTISSSIPAQIQPTTKKFEWQSLIPILYLIGLLFFLIQFLFQFGSLILLFLKNKKNKASGYTYVTLNSTTTPFSFFRWIFYNPDSFNESEIKLILTHEKIHANQWHSVDMLFTQLSCVFFWFNPLIWLYRKEVKQNLEYIADSKTQEKSISSNIYQRLLLKTAVPNQNISLSNNFYNSLIKERIIMLKKSRSQPKNQWKYLLILPLLAGLLISMNRKEIYVKPEVQNTLENNSLLTDNGTLEIIFNKNITGNQLDVIENKLQALNISMTIHEIKRNSKGEIEAINISFKTENGSTNYSNSDPDGIDPFYFTMSDDGSFGVGKVFIEALNNTVSEKSEKTFIFNDENGELLEIKEDTITNNNKPKTRAKIYKTDSTYAFTSHKANLKNDSLYLYKILPLDSVNVNGRTNINADQYYLNNTPVNLVGESSTVYSPKLIKKNISRKYHDKNKPLIILNGITVPYESLTNLNPEAIESVSVLKGKAAIDTFDEKGENGVILIQMKDANSLKTKKPSDKSGPWTIGRTEVNNTTFIDDKDPSKNSFIAYITKYTSNDMLDKHVIVLKKSGITVKYSRLRRNKAGEITSVKISLTNEKGSESNATWTSNTGIPSIEFGETEGSLIARTSDMNKN